MKRLSCTLLIVVALIMGASTMQAQPYKMGIGAVVGTMEGASFKVFLSNKLALQADLGFKYGVYRYEYYYNNHSTDWFWTVEVNPNIMYESTIKDWNVGGLYWFAGGGISLGYVLTNVYIYKPPYGHPTNPHGRFGVNAMGGVEFAFKKIPLTTQADVRPGYGLFFGDGARSFFDWGFNLSVRYTF